MKATIVPTRVIELRKNRRYSISTPVFFYWATPNESPQSGEGMTRDVDTSGAYIIARQLPPIGARVQIDIMLPGLLGGVSGAHLTGEGLVLRVEPHNGKIPDSSESGFAVSMQFHLESSESVLSHLTRSELVM